VRAQVDRDLTTVSWVDRLLGLIKNLGRYRTTLRERLRHPLGFSLYRPAGKHVSVDGEFSST
jgi:hypothetical protein